MFRGVGIAIALACAGWAGYALSAVAEENSVSAQTPKKEAAGEKKSTGEKHAHHRVFEMRVYYANPGKMKALEARFRDHTNKLFEKHGMTIIGFWKPIEHQPSAKKDAKNEHADKLIYILAYPSLEAAQKSWDNFRKDKDWIEAKKASEVDGVLVGKVESIYMNPTDYSPLK